MAEIDRGTFYFLFRSDQGRIDRATWWRATLPLAALALFGTTGWWWLQPYAHHDLNETPFLAPMTVVAFAYLLVYTLAVILIVVCEYNLSAKRFRDRGRPGALAALLPLSLLVGGAVIWFIPRSFGAVPPWVAPVVIAALLLMVLWNVIELGVRPDRTAP